jgi:hypothetical protein
VKVVLSLGISGRYVTPGRQAIYLCRPGSEVDTMDIADYQYGFGRILTVPGVHACYGKGDAQLRGWVEFPAPTTLDEMVTWQDK